MNLNEKEDNVLSVTRRYIFTQAELKKKLGLKGNIGKFGLWSGRSPNDEEAGKSPDKDKYFLTTVEGTDVE